ncbi:LysR family transcriptional regulator [Pseudomonas izuensis]|uniref:LysR family transcriptional regulator n=1 Tax=Pseudomonas izuensis TaxID=2684212 RepID=A0ABM7RSA5_9PSED|nr:LysR substrate-binding domain-containing protein [Pseudomonas izuensis]BCX68245.1 LysR family transcriptional regulator [Pseudomonas izuensis]
MEWTRRLRLNHLQTLVSLAETGSVSEAARVTFTTQPALSKWLKELEESVGTPLFERHARGLKPTPQGLMLLRHAQRVLSEMDRAQQNLAAMLEGSSYRVSIGASPASAPNLVPAAIMQFLHLHPNAQVELQENTMDVLLERLEQGQLDLVVGRFDNFAPRQSLRSELLYQETMRVICRPGHPLTHQRVIDWTDLQAHDWIMWPVGTPIRSKLDTALTSAGQRPLAYRIESSSLIANLWMLQLSDMLSIASDRVADHFTDRGLIVPLEFELDALGALGMCWREGTDSDPGLIDLLESLRHAATTETEFPDAR